MFPLPVGCSFVVYHYQHSAVVMKGYAALYHSNAVVGLAIIATRDGAVTLRCKAVPPSPFAIYHDGASLS